MVNKINLTIENDARLGAEYSRNQANVKTHKNLAFSFRAHDCSQKMPYILRNWPEISG